MGFALLNATLPNPPYARSAGVFITDHRGDFAAALGREEEGVLTARFDLDFLDRHRAAWGFFRDRRVELYGG